VKVSFDRLCIKFVSSIFLPDMVVGYSIFMYHYGHGHKQIFQTRNCKEFVVD